MVELTLDADPEVPVTYSPEEAVGLIQEAGIVGAGGAGFPTYVKYQQPPRALVVNAAESEPGYYADKLMLRDYAEELIHVFEWLDKTFSMDVHIIGAEDVAKPYMERLEQVAHDMGIFSIGYFPAEYRFGQERLLVKELLGVDVPKGDLPQDHGIVVNNVETLINMYRAVFRDRPVTTKFVHLYGEVNGIGVYEAPIGTLTADLIRVHGEDPADFKDCTLFDGGPLLSDQAASPMGEECLYAVRKTTNGLLVVAPDKLKTKRKFYPHPDFEHNSIDVPWAVDKIVNVEEKIDRVRIPLHGTFGDDPNLAVEVGATVKRGDLLGQPTQGLSVAVHASIPGEITEVTADFIEIVRS